MENFLVLKETEGKLPAYFKDWLYGTIAVSTLNEMEAKRYATRAEYKKDLSKLRRRFEKYRPIKIQS